MALRRSGPLRAYRIADIRHPIFDGAGAALHGGRWNSPGRRVIYAAASFSGALLELLVHANIGRIPKNQVYIEITIPAAVAVEEVAVDDVRGWDAPDQHVSRAFGDAWFDARRSAVLLVPSVVTRIDRNVLLNQNHPEFRRISASQPKPVLWDQRLLRE